MTTTMSGLLTSARPQPAQSSKTFGRIENGQQLRGLPTPAEIAEMIAGVTVWLVGRRPAILEQPLVRLRETDRAGARGVVAVDRAERASAPADLQVALARIID